MNADKKKRKKRAQMSICLLIEGTIAMNSLLPLPKKVVNFLIQQLRVPADVEGPRAQLPPVVDRLHPPLRGSMLGLRLVVFDALDFQNYGHTVLQPKPEVGLRAA